MKSKTEFIQFCVPGCLLLFTSFAGAAEFELTGKSSRNNPYCIDMRTLAERAKAPAITSTPALEKLFNCKKTFVLPLDEDTSKGLIDIYLNDMAQFRGHKVLMWSTLGIRAKVIAMKLKEIGIGVEIIVGGTYYLADAMGM